MISPGEILDILEQVKYKNWKFVLYVNGEFGWYLQIRFDAPDNDDPSKVSRQYCRKWKISQHMTKSEIVTTAFKAVISAEEHEARETFKYKGVSIFNPHIDVEALVKLHKNNPLDTRDQSL